MAKKDDYYDILEVNRDVSEAEIREAFRKLALKWHPDRWTNKDEKKIAREKMKKVGKAYEVLSNQEKRRDYDRYGSTERFAQGSSGGEFEGQEDFFQDIFDTFFGRGNSRARQETRTGSQNRPQAGSDILINVTLTFKESVLGVKKRITLELEKSCSACSGRTKTHVSNHNIITCSVCKGTGTTTSRTVLGTFRTTCSQCHGKGGKLATARETIELNIPRGVSLGKKLRFQGIGNDGWYGGEKGDIYVSLEVKENPYFRREGNDIHVNIPISFLDAILGGIAEVITLEPERKREIAIPPRTQTEDCLAIRGLGCYTGINHTTRGNFYIWLQIKLPKEITPITEKILSDLQQRTNWNPNSAFIKENKDVGDK